MPARLEGVTLGGCGLHPEAGFEGRYGREVCAFWGCELPARYQPLVPVATGKDRRASLMPSAALGERSLSFQRATSSGPGKRDVYGRGEPPKERKRGG